MMNGHLLPRLQLPNSTIHSLVGFTFLILFLVHSLPAVSRAQPHSVSPITDVTLEKIHVMNHEGRTTSGPAIQVDEAGHLHLAWIQKDPSGINTYYLQSSKNLENFPAPVQVNPPHLATSSLHAPPALALGPGGEVYLTWTSPHPKAKGNPFASLLQLSRSLDNGHTFLPPVQVNDDAVATGHSFDHLATAPNGAIHIAWLDAREGKRDPATYTAQSTDQGKTVEKNLKIDDHTCVCCRSNVAIAGDGTVYVAWRKIFPGNVREAVVSRSTDGGRTYSPPMIIGHDQWVFAGCPHRPASMGVDAQGRLYVVWYTEGPDDTPGVYIAMSDDQGRTFTPRRRLNISKGTFPDHPQMAVDAHGRVVVIWEEQSPVRKEIVMSLSADRGATFSSPRKLNQRKAKHPAATVNHQGRALVAWSEQVTFPHWSTVIQPIRLPAIHQ